MLLYYYSHFRRMFCLFLFAECLIFKNQARFSASEPIYTYLWSKQKQTFRMFLEVHYTMKYSTNNLLFFNGSLKL